jgi:hypothetical protein
MRARAAIEQHGTRASGTLQHVRHQLDAAGRTAKHACNIHTTGRREPERRA